MRQSSVPTGEIPIGGLGQRPVCLIWLFDLQSLNITVLNLFDDAMLCPFPSRTIFPAMFGNRTTASFGWCVTTLRFFGNCLLTPRWRLVIYYQW